MKVSISLLFAAMAKLVSARDDIHVLMYETDTSLESDPISPLFFFKERSGFADLPTTVYGGGLEYNGFGDKYQTLRAILEVIDPTKLVVVADARDVALNIPENAEEANAAIDRFIDNYDRLTVNDPHAVVMSAESQCCVSAMTHAHPTEYFDPITKKRTKRACSSGKPGCYWDQNENIYAWVDFHRQRAHEKTGIDLNSDNIGDVYLNAGLMTGYPADLINLLDVLDIDPSEDDQAVLSGLMYQFPDMIVLDYGQDMFGNNQWPLGLEPGCVFEKSVEHEVATQSTLVHKHTNAEPLIIHTPGKFYGCLDILIEELGGVSQERYLQDSPAGNPRILRREGRSVVMRNDEEETTPPRSLEEDELCECQCDSSGRRNLSFTSFLTGLTGIGRFFFGSSMQEHNQSPLAESRTSIAENLQNRIGGELDIKSRIVQNRDFERLVETVDPEVAEVEVENYGNYGQYGVASNYGQYGVASNYGQYGVASNYGQYGLVTSRSENDGNYGQYGVASNYGQYGVASNYGQYGVASNYGQYGVASNYGQYGLVTSRSENDGNYGQYGDVDSSASNYGNYGIVNSCAEVCANICSESEDDASANYGNASTNYGTSAYGNYGQNGALRRRLD